MDTAQRRLLYVDGDAEARLLMQELLAPHQIDIVATDEEARVLARRVSYDVYLLASGPDASGLALCAWLHRIDPRTPIIYVSSTGTAAHESRAVAAGALRFLVKPLDPDLLRSTLRLLLKLAEIETRRARIAEELAIEEELTARAARARETVRAARAKAQRSLECTLRMKAYRAFLDAGGNRANFERTWPTVASDADTATK
ncbi:MAG TPA: response regulator [Burkholderiales bacterium]|nr:response regulator [Burkholderiales bacterium]